MRYTRFSRRIYIIPLVDLYLDPCFSWDIVSSNSKVNEIYILFVILHSLWSGNNLLCSLSVGNVLLFVIRVLLSVMITTVSSIFLIVSKILLCTLDELIGWFFFSERMSRANLVVNGYYLSLQWLRVRYGGYRWYFWHCHLVLHILCCCYNSHFSPFVNITRLEMELCFLFFVVEKAVTFFEQCYVLVGVVAGFGHFYDRFLSFGGSS